MSSSAQFASRSPLDQEPDIDLARVLEIFTRRRLVLLSCVLAALVLSLLYLAVAKRKYMASAELQLLTGNEVAASPNNTGTDVDSPLQLTVTMQTYVGVLTSDNLALQVVQELDLESKQDFRRAEVKVPKWEQSLPLQDTRFRREAVVGVFKKNLRVSASAGSRLLTVSYLSPDPELAKQILNQLLTDFVAYNYAVRYNASVNAEGWLSKQLVDLKQEVERTQQEAIALQRQTGLYGNDAAHDLIVTRLDALNQELTSAEQNRIVKGAILQVVQTSNPEAISNLSGLGSEANSGAVNSLALIQSLRTQEATLSSQLAQLQQKFGANYPRVIEINGQLAAVHREIDSETERLHERVQNDYDAARIQESKLRDQFREQKDLAGKANDLSIRYLIANREATSSRDLYEHLLERLKETGIMAGMHDSNIDIVDHAHVGASPASPNIPIVLASGVGGGLVLGVLLVLFSEGLDPSIHSLNELQQSSRRPALGSIPRRAGYDLLKHHMDDRSPFPESFRALRTIFLHLGLPNGIKVLMVTSPRATEGKSTVIWNLALALAQQGRKVLVVDADLRGNGLTKRFNLDGKPGLTDMLAQPPGRIELPDVIDCRTGIDLLPTGTPVGDAADVLSGPAMRQLLALMQARYDFILVDSAPLLGMTDAIALGQLMQRVLVVCRANKTPREALIAAISLLDRFAVPVLGVVLNGTEAGSNGYLSVATPSHVSVLRQSDPVPGFGVQREQRSFNA